MTSTQQQKHIELIFERAKTLMLSKGNDYSTEDRLKIFKAVGQTCSMHPAKVALVLATVKIHRMCNLLDQGKQVENESVDDTAIDFICYGILTHAILTEPK